MDRIRDRRNSGSRLITDLNQHRNPETTEKAQHIIAMQTHATTNDAMTPLRYQYRHVGHMRCLTRTIASRATNQPPRTRTRQQCRTGKPYPPRKENQIYQHSAATARRRTPRPPACTTANPTADEQPHRQQHPHDPTSSTFSHQKPLRKATIQSAVRTTSRLSHVPAQLLCHTSSICDSSARGHVPRIIVAHIDRRPQASQAIRHLHAVMISVEGRSERCRSADDSQWGLFVRPPWTVAGRIQPHACGTARGFGRFPRGVPQERGMVEKSIV